MAKRSEAFSVGATVYDGFVDSGREFTADEVKLALRRKLSAYKDEAFAALVERVFDAIDRKREATSDDEQRLLFPVDGVYRLGDGRRIAKRAAMFSHAKEALAIDDQNREGVVRANERKHEELELLRPYWGVGTTKAEAVAAYLADHPEADVA